MKIYYKIIIVGVLIVLFGLLFSMLSPVQTFAGQIKETIIANFPVLQEVLVVNEEPIDVNVINQSPSGPEGEVITFFDNVCEWSTSPAFDVSGFSKIAIFAEGPGSNLSWRIQTSPNGITWREQDNIGSLTDVYLYDIAGRYYRLQSSVVPSGCFTVKGYLMK